MFLGKGKSHNCYFCEKANRTEIMFTVAGSCKDELQKYKMLNTAGICRAERGLALFVQRRVAKRQNVEHNGEVKTQR